MSDKTMHCEDCNLRLQNEPYYYNGECWRDGKKHRFCRWTLAQQEAWYLRQDPYIAAPMARHIAARKAKEGQHGQA